MLYSMTGYGRFVHETDSKTIVVEIRSLNSKFLDLKVRMPQGMLEYELEVRRTVTARLERGKVDMNIEMKATNTQQYTINAAAYKGYYHEIARINHEMGIKTPDDLSATLVRIPNVVEQHDTVWTAEEWSEIQQTIHKAIDGLLEFRRDEGRVLEATLRTQLDTIQTLLKSIEPYEPLRIEKVRERLYTQLADLKEKAAIDENRLEQELIYYIEKYDVSEEKVRLTQHCTYFLAEMNANTNDKGRKLTFIAQEMGREINTIGSKANLAEIQRIVVQMKDELEKIKEQLANIL